MSEKENQTISFVAHEADMARMERSNKRWFILALIELTVIVAMIVGFVLYESQYEVVEETTTRQVVTQDVDTGDGDAVVSGIGGVTDGAGEADGSQNDDKKTLPQKEEKVND